MFLFALFGALFMPTANAQETVDIGVIKNSDVRVVQKLLYPKSNRIELGLTAGWAPFNAFLTTPSVQIAVNWHMNEVLAFGGVIGGGYGLKTAVYRELDSPTYGVAPDSYRYLTSAIFGAEFSPIYAKMNIGGKKIIHYDIFGSAKLGITVEQSVIPSGGIAVAPTLSLGVGSRLFVSPKGAIRVELRDDMLIESRKLTGTTHFKQNATIILGYSLLIGGDKGERE